MAQGRGSEQGEPAAVYVGRQPIFDRGLRVVGYELLYRSSEVNAARFADQERAVAETVVNSFLEIGLDTLCGAHSAFINVSARFLLGDGMSLLPRERVVVEILEDVERTPELLAGVRSLKDRGYTIALDDFRWDDRDAQLLELVQIVKVDVLATPLEAIPPLLEQLRPFRVRLLAEKVETHEVFERCRDLGFQLFQGYFLSRPKVVSQQRLPASRIGAVQLLSRLHEREISTRTLEKAIAGDVALSYKLLRYINSSFFALPRRVDSIRQAIVLLGLRTIRRWASVLVLAGGDEQPAEVMTTALVRARMCEALGARTSPQDEDSFFTVGLFSALDAIMGTTMDSLLAQLPLTERVAAALLTREGELGRVLENVLRYEQGDFERLDLPGVSPADLRQAWIEAVTWARDVSSLGR